MEAIKELIGYDPLDLMPDYNSLRMIERRTDSDGQMVAKQDEQGTRMNISFHVASKSFN